MNIELFDTTKRSICYQILKNIDKINCETHIEFTIWSINDKKWNFFFKMRNMIENKFDKFIKSIRETKIKIYEKTTNSTFKKIFANVVVLFDICFVTALISWIFIQTIDATKTQFDSYVLLFFISTKFLILINNISQLTNVTKSVKNFFLFQKQIVEDVKNLNVEYMFEKKNVFDLFSFRFIFKFDFFKNIVEKFRFIFFDFWQSTNFFDKFFCFLFESISILISRFHENRQNFEKIHFSMIDFFFKMKNIIFDYIIFEFDLNRNILFRSIYIIFEWKNKANTKK